MASIVPNCLSKFLFRKMEKCSSEGDKIICNRIEKLENIFVPIFRILLWEDPYLTSFCILFLNIIFGLIIYLDLKFYGIIFIATLSLILVQIWAEQIFQIFLKKDLKTEMLDLSKNNPPKYRSDETPSTLSNIYFIKSQEIFKVFFDKAKHFRKSQPGMFCTVTCVFFLFLSVIGRSVSGVASIYLISMLALILPGIIIHFLPPYIISSLSNFICSNPKDENIKTDEIESFLPDSNQEALEVLRLAGEPQLSYKDEEENSTDLLLERISNQASDTESLSSKFSFYPESSFMPSPENSIDFFELDLPSSDRTEKSEFEDLDNINFRSKHFNGDSSDEDEFTKGLKSLTQDNNLATVDDENASFGTLKPESPNVSPVKEAITLSKSEKEKKCEKETSSDTDSFEMISEEDM